ncbi:MAG: CxxxxCH/CxxCH domain-containing protein, partial [Desulfuromonadaceae bacterium]
MNAPYLRMQNDQDQMCRNCHRTRDVISHTAGSHPVNISYSSSASAKAKIADGSLLATPVQTPTAIPGKYSQAKLVNGMVLCSTCHGTHGTDSRSSTFDIVTSITFRPLSASKGYLLRVDAYGKTVNDVNICTNCHAKKKNHNLGGKNGTKPAQCNDCHSGHVEYDPAAVGDELLKNNNLIRRYLQYSSVGRKSKRIFYRYTGATTKEFTNASGKGVCQGCHYLPNSGADDHFTPGGTFPNIPSPDRLDCKTCHSHTQTSGSFSYGASSNCLSACHGWPPVNNNTTGVGSRTAGYVGYDESTTPHGSHAVGGATYYNFVCEQCHKGATMPQTPSTTQSYYREVFINTTGAGIYSGIRTTPTYSATLNLTPSPCNNVYCHSRGNSGTLLWKTGQNNITWGEGKKDSIIGLAGATRCNTCHDTAMATGSHTKHLVVGFGYGCVMCHATTVSDNTTLRDAAKQQVGSHVNGVRNVEFNDVSPAVGTTCATIACHSNGKGAAPVQLPVWGTATTGACGDCHQTKQFGNISSAAHNVSAHLSTALDDQCVRCHTYNGETAAPHVNGTINVNYSGAGSCAVNACHGTITAPTWTASYTGKDVCTKCHGTLSTTAELTANRYRMAPSLPAGTDTGNVSANPKTGAHQTHLRYTNNFSNYSTVDYRCRSCHGIT